MQLLKGRALAVLFLSFRLLAAQFAPAQDCAAPALTGFTREGSERQRE